MGDGRSAKGRTATRRRASRPRPAAPPRAAGVPAPADTGPPAAVPVPPAQPEPADPLRDFFFRKGEPGSPVLEIGVYAPPEEAEAPEEPREYLAFRLGEEEYAVEIRWVAEVLKAPVVTEVPRAPRHVLGVILVRGEVVPVVDARRRLGLPPRTAARGSRAIVCDVGDGPVGLLVDGVSQVVRLPASAVEARPEGVGGVDPETLAGLGRDGGRLFILLDAPVLLRGPAEGAAGGRA